MHCVCCPIALVSLERNRGERKRDAGEKKGRKKCVSCTGKRVGRSERAQKLQREKERIEEVEEQRKKQTE